MTLTEFPSQYEKVFDRAFDITEYGVCVISDILQEVNANAIVVENQKNGEVILCRPRHNQTEIEKRKTNTFKLETIELLSHAPQYSMQFNKFVPAYHHHFGHQCRVSEYGFTKLIELFEAIPDIVQIIDCGKNNDDRQVRLTPEEAIKVLNVQIEQILRSMSEHSKEVLLTQVCSEFTRRYGYALNADAYNCQDVQQLLLKLKNIKVTKTADGETVLELQKCTQHDANSFYNKGFSFNQYENHRFNKKRKQKSAIGQTYGNNYKSSNVSDRAVKPQNNSFFKPQEKQEYINYYDNFRTSNPIEENEHDLSTCIDKDSAYFASSLDYNYENLQSCEAEEYGQFANVEKIWPPKSPKVRSGGQGPSESRVVDISSILSRYGYGYNYLDEIFNGSQFAGLETSIFHNPTTNNVNEIYK